MDDNLEQRIRERAYEIWENEGRPEGRGAEHWDQARMEYADAREEQTQASGAAGEPERRPEQRPDQLGAVPTGASEAAGGTGPGARSR